jgi:hypothetical protein
VAIKKQTNRDGTWEVTATGRDVNELRGVFKETAAADAQNKREAARANPSRRMRKGAQTLDVNGAQVDGMRRHGFQVADSPPSIVMPSHVLGFSADGRVVYVEQPQGYDAEPLETTRGEVGWAFK